MFEGSCVRSRASNDQNSEYDESDVCAPRHSGRGGLHKCKSTENSVAALISERQLRDALTNATLSRRAEDDRAWYERLKSSLAVR